MLGSVRCPPVLLGFDDRRGEGPAHGPALGQDVAASGRRTVGGTGEATFGDGWWKGSEKGRKERCL